jgi:hypothetical protein
MIQTLAIVIAFILVACCGSSTTAKPTLSAIEPTSTTIHVAPPTTPCILSPRPQPYQLVGMASPGGIVVTKSDLAELLTWLTAMSDWAASAQLCLEARR